MKRISPTHRGWATILLAVGLLMLCFVRPGFLTAGVAALLIAVVIVGFVGTLMSLIGITVEREPCQDGRRGKMVSLPVRIVNRSNRRRQAIVVAECCGFSPEDIDFHVVPSLGPGEGRSVQRPVFAAARGEFEQRSIIIKGGDPAGIFQCTKTFPAPQKLLVEPAVEPLAWLPLGQTHRSQASMLGHSVGNCGIGQNIFGVREYRHTDGMHFIDWKSTARQRRLMVREFEEDKSYVVNIFLDVEAASVNKDLVTNNFEYLITAAASITDYVSGLNCQLLFSAGTELGVNQFRGSAQSVHNEIFRLLTHLRPSDTTVPEQIESCLEYLDYGSTLYCFTMNLSEQMTRPFELLLRQGIEIRWVCALPGMFEPSEIKEEIPETRRLVTPILANPQMSISNLLANSAWQATHV